MRLSDGCFCTAYISNECDEARVYRLVCLESVPFVRTVGVLEPGEPVLVVSQANPGLDASVVWVLTRFGPGWMSAAHLGRICSTTIHGRFVPL